MQPLRLAANPKAGFIHVLYRCRCHVVAHRIGETLEASGTVLADPSDRRGGQIHPEEVGHQFGQTLLGQQLVVQEIEYEGADPRAVLHGRSDPFGKYRPGLRAAGRATATVRAVFRDDQRSRFGEVQHLPGNVVCRHRRGQRRAARRAGLRIMVDGGVGCLGLAQSFTRMARLTTGLLARPFPQTAHPRRLLQPVAGRWLAAVAAVQPELALQFGDPCSQRRHLRGVARLLPKQQGNQVAFRELAEHGAIHRILESTTPPRVKRNLCRLRRHPLTPPAPARRGRETARRHPPGQLP